MKNSLYKWVLALGLLSSLMYSCQQEDLRPPKRQEKTEGEAQGASVSLKLEGDWQGEDKELRGFSLQKDGQGIPQLKIEDKTYDITLYIRQMGNEAITTVAAKAVCKTNDAGQKHFRIEVPKFTLQGAGQSFRKGVNGWYVCGVIGEAPKHFDEQTATLFEPLTTERKLPLGFPWTPLTITEEGHGQQHNARFNLIGTLLRVGLRNNLVVPVEAKYIVLRSEGFAFSGTFEPSKVTDDDLNQGRHLSFTNNLPNAPFKIPTSAEAATSSGTRILAGHEDMLGGNIYVWGYPINTSATIQATMEVTTRPKGMTAEELASSILPDLEKVVSVRESVPSTLKAPKDGYKHSRIHKAPLLITSDLMITEQYVFNEAHLNLSIIELHNPTLDPIELKHYALMKVGRDHVQGSNNNRVVAYPQEDYDYAHRWVDTSDKSGGYKECKMNSAVLMPLDMRTAVNDGSYWRWITYEAWQRDPDQPNKSKHHDHSLKVRVVRTGAYPGDNVVSTTFRDPGLDPVLDPGKTILILGPGYVEYTPDQDGYGLLYPTKPYPYAGGAGQRGQLGPGVQPIQSYLKGYCQYVVAMANYSQPKSNSRNDAASVNHLSSDQGVLLVKQKLDPVNHPSITNGSIRKVIDCSIPYNNALHSLTQIERVTYDRTHFRTRIDGDFFPSTKFNSKDWVISDMSWSNQARLQWKSREYETARGTLGTRSFVRNGSKRHQNEWGANYVAPTKQW